MWRLLMAIGALSAAVLSGCGYKPLEAPCAMSEDDLPTATQRPSPELTVPPGTLQALSYAGREAHRAPDPFDVTVSDCGPLRPMNVERLR